MSSASTSRSLKFQDNEQIEESASLSSSSILKSRSSTKMSGKLIFILPNVPKSEEISLKIIKYPI
jgi:hypothetical protein